VVLQRRDGTRILRATLPRWVVAVALGALAVGAGLVATSLSAIYGDYAALRDQRATLAAMLPRLADQQEVVEAYQAQARHLRAEIDSWREVHARILEPFGPDAGPGKRGSGIGGGPSRSPIDGDADRFDIKEEMARLADMVQEEGEQLRALEQFLSRAGRVLASLPSRWPIRGTVNSEFGRRLSPWAPVAEHHSGIDIGAPIGTPVQAPAPGTVVFSGSHAEYGLAVIIEHGNDTKSLYGHLSKLGVAAGQQVRRGDLVALTGNTGRSSGPHLHYEVQVGGEAVNPYTYLWE
jgi:murein DD-endopeptidase MepM/ murein hydrolase activator NlpD